LHDDNTIAFKNRDVATLLPGLSATLIDRIVAALETARLDPDSDGVWTDSERDAALEVAIADARSQAIQEASDAVLEACVEIDPDNKNKTVTKVMRAAQANIRALDE
jgi:hypothetical protein